MNISLKKLLTESKADNDAIFSWFVPELCPGPNHEKTASQFLLFKWITWI